MMSLLQGRVDRFIEKRSLTGWKANRLRYGMAFVGSPLWEEAVFRSLFIGLFGWNPWVVLALFVVLHIPQNIVSAKNEARGYIETYQFEEKTWTHYFVVVVSTLMRTTLQLIGAWVITHIYLRSENLVIAVLLHFGFNFSMFIFTRMALGYSVRPAFLSLGIPTTQKTTAQQENDRFADILGRNLPAPRSLGLRNFLSELSTEPESFRRQPTVRKLVNALYDVQERGKSIRATLKESDLLPLGQVGVVVLPENQSNIQETYQQLVRLTKDGMQIFVVSNRSDVPEGLISISAQKLNLTERKIQATDLDSVLNQSEEWKKLAQQTSAVNLSLIMSKDMTWIKNVPVGASPLAALQQVIILEELLQVLSFLTAPRPSVELLKKAAEAVARAA